MASRLTFRRRYDPLLVVVDAGCAALVAWGAHALVVDGGADLQRYRAASAGLVVSWVLLARSTGLYRRAALRTGTWNLEQSLLAAALSAGALVLADLVVLQGRLDGGWVAAVGVGLLLVGVLTRAVLARSRRHLRALGLGLERYAVVGTAPSEVGRPGFTVVATLPASVTGEEVLARVRELGLDGVVLRAGETELADRLRPALASMGVDLLVAGRR